MDSSHFLFTFNIDNIDEEYTEVIDDLIKYAVLVLGFYIIQAFGVTGSFQVSDESIQNVIYVLLSVLFYHLVYKKSILIKYGEK